MLLLCCQDRLKVYSQYTSLQPCLSIEEERNARQHTVSPTSDGVPAASATSDGYSTSATEHTRVLCSLVGAAFLQGRYLSMPLETAGSFAAVRKHP